MDIRWYILYNRMYVNYFWNRSYFHELFWYFPRVYVNLLLKMAIFTWNSKAKNKVNKYGNYCELKGKIIQFHKNTKFWISSNFSFFPFISSGLFEYSLRTSADYQQEIQFYTNRYVRTFLVCEKIIPFIDLHHRKPSNKY